MPIYHRKEWPRNKHHVVAKVSTLRSDRIFYGSRAEAKLLESNLRLELETKAAANRSSGRPSKSVEKPFLNFCLDQYAPHARLHVQASTWSTRKFHVNNMIEFFHDKKAVLFSEITTELLDEYKLWRMTPRTIVKTVKDKKTGEEIEKRTRVVATGRTVNNELKTFSTMRTYAADSLGIKIDVKIKSVPERGKGNVEAWTSDELQRLYAACERDRRGRRLLPILVFLVNTGCRKGEAIHAERKWVNLERKNSKGEPAPILNITPNPHWQPKNGKPRDVPISDALLPFLERARGGSSPYVFTWSRKNAPEKRFPYRSFPNKTFRRLVEAAGLSGGPHRLRHSFASAYLAKDPNMWMLSGLLGHGHEKVTKLYTHFLPDHQEGARNKVNLGPAVGPAALEAATRWERKRRAR